MKHSITLLVALLLSPLALLRAADTTKPLRHLVYTIDPAKGDDASAPGQAWKTFKPLQNIRLAAGDQVVIHPGNHPETLRLSGQGTLKDPVTVRFLPGTHLIGSESLLALPLFVSNSQDTEEPVPIAILVDHAKNIRFEGDGPDRTKVLFNGRVVQIVNDHAENIAYQGITFDLKRPTSSEFRVLEVEGATALIQIAEGSDYAIENGKLCWKGDWGPSAVSMEADLQNGWLRRRKDRLLGWSAKGQEEAVATEIGERRVRLVFPGSDCGMQVGFQYIFRGGPRDRVAVFSDRSKDISFRDCRFHALTGMGFVSQFTENFTVQRVDIAPPAGTIRTLTGWADLFQFSNCRGDILMDSCRFSGMQDDAMNVHGTYLGISDKPANNQFLITYLHRQTYGFPPCVPGDELAVINERNLREYPGNHRGKVLSIERKTSRNWLVTFDGPAPSFEPTDGIDNVTWHPNVTARNNHISMDAVRGFLLTSRGRLIIEGNTFDRCSKSGILVNNMVGGWRESGPIRDLLIKGNRFFGCGIWIEPKTSSKHPEEWVHENIRIMDNFFDSVGIETRDTDPKTREAGIKPRDVGIDAQGVRGLTITGNRSAQGQIQMNIQPSCSEVSVANNDLKAAK